MIDVDICPIEVQKFKRNRVLDLVLSYFMEERLVFISIGKSEMIIVNHGSKPTGVTRKSWMVGRRPNRFQSHLW